jgi:hypothetical protein
MREMRRAYVILGQLDNGELDRVYAVCHSMARADELCYEAELEDPEIQYNYYEVIEEDD